MYYGFFVRFGSESFRRSQREFAGVFKDKDYRIRESFGCEGNRKP